MEKAVIDVLTYFKFFSYAPSFEEIYTFLPIKTTKQELRRLLDLMVQSERLIKKRVSTSHIFDLRLLTFNCLLYTLPPHGIFFDKRVDRARISRKKIDKAMSCVQLLARIPSIQLIGLSGGVAMMNAQYQDDIDFFVITSSGRLWTTRIYILGGAELCGVRRKRTSRRVKDSFCFNLFFEETDLSVPKEKHNLYVAHEIVQMKPIVMKKGVYNRFLMANQWVLRFFPNKQFFGSAQDFQYTNRSNEYKKNTNYIGNAVEFLCKKIQLIIMDRHRTTERISDTQLWFFPRDFEKKLRKSHYKI